MTGMKLIDAETDTYPRLSCLSFARRIMSMLQHTHLLEGPPSVSWLYMQANLDHWTIRLYESSSPVNLSV